MNGLKRIFFIWGVIYKYKSEQSFLLAKSSANLSNIAAESDIFLINSENISIEVIDDLLTYHGDKCITLE